ncbi:glucose-6-phosphate dehydrogenase [Ardenticatena maritima]|uniref:Glucose-6-phosphate 1-dehydrogenase n=1 Tax=Ardenticatena maritima TaxID=872965 RepID=A0A0P6YX22_9CHLR|nr:glucose-6-phosphate dehydrogenase [Ardenticatena maritima]KPL88643.1 glucose-6-phosphate dehydrogenase [Ardenticatena maritima]
MSVPATEFISRRPDPAAIVIFGASGDLTRRKLMPALYALYTHGLLPQRFAILGFSRRDWSDDDFRTTMRDAVAEFGRVPLDTTQWDEFAARLFYLDAQGYDHLEDYQRLRDRLNTLDETEGTDGNRLFYAATPPQAFVPIVESLGAVGLNQPPREGAWVRLVIEKPFGTDLASARALNARIQHVFDESQIYRIDHYLGKEAVQNLLAFRFANSLFEPIWNRNHIEQVQITVAESIGVENRAGYYDRVGALRDMVQNHLMQLVTLIAMEPPASFDAEAVRNEKVKVLRAIRPFDENAIRTRIVRGQYGPGVVNEKPVRGYREEEGVAPDSTTETYVALQLEIENWRWAGIPFYLRTGKRLPRKVSEIAVIFRRPPLLIFDDQRRRKMEQNVLYLQIQPHEGLSLSVNIKIPGATMRLEPVMMDFCYHGSFEFAIPEAYERLLLDAWLGDATLFIRADETEASWALFTPVLEAWQRMPPPDFPNYAAGTWGPPEADELLARNGHAWKLMLL